MCKTSDSPLGRDREGNSDEVGSKEAFERIYLLFFPKVRGWLLQRGFKEQQAEELAQDTFTRVHGGLDGFRGDSSLFTWILTIAKRLASNHYRDSNALKRRGIEVSLEAKEEAEGLGLPEASQDPDPLDNLLSNEFRESLDRAVQALPPRQKGCIQLRARVYKYKEIAQLLDIKIDTVKSHLHQAREQLKDAFPNHSFTSGGDQEDEP